MPVSFRRAFLAPTLAIALTAFGSLAHASDDDRRAPSALSAADRLSYTTAFDALRRGDLDAARASARAAQDHVLLGQVEFERLFHPDYSASYEELAAWLEEYYDLPCADRAYNLAMRRRPDDAPEPRRPGRFSNRSWAAASAAGQNTEGDPMKAARVALNRDDLAGAVVIGQEIGDWWSVALAQYRLGEFGAATTAFEKVLDDPTEDSWVRAGAAFWAARSAARSSQQDRVQPLLRRSAAWPATFYGQIALRQLGEDMTIENLGPRPYETAPALQRALYVPEEPIGVDAAELEEFIRAEPRARRTVAFFEIGRRTDARDELRTGMRSAVGDRARELWAALGRALGPRVTGSDSDARRVDANNYAQPVIEPEGGFTIERSLVYAIARKETGFNARARSGAGAYGLMQVMPGTAAELSGDRGFVSTPERLYDPSVNARMGQAYVNRVLARPEINGDLLRVAASYNAGPGPMMAAVRKLGPDADPLLLIETIDVPQARDYVEKVVAAYWIYQRMNGRPLNTLDAVASGAPLVPLSLDFVPPPPEPVQPVEVAAVLTTGG
ncbi:lytic transglycosylase domain-containing protein [Brevundimonas sp. FT23042]|uniref:lytic transglycosylase domain-containing protein n=1 Tax=Brevundimonas sp. FT23042 TaxID=3393749 RepID=UPI003B58AB37